MIKRKKINLTFWKNKKVLITGHTGFKGSWLSLILKYLGCEIYGYALMPEDSKSIFKEFYWKNTNSIMQLQEQKMGPGSGPIRALLGPWASWARDPLGTTWALGPLGSWPTWAGKLKFSE